MAPFSRIESKTFLMRFSFVMKKAIARKCFEAVFNSLVQGLCPVGQTQEGSVRVPRVSAVYGDNTRFSHEKRMKHHVARHIVRKKQSQLGERVEAQLGTDDRFCLSYRQKP